MHTAQLNDFLPELQSLLDDFHLADQAHKLHSAADEMELYCAVTSSHRKDKSQLKKFNVLNEVSLSCQVWKEFQATFRLQEQRKSFPWYGSKEVGPNHQERRSPGVALKKEANWIPFIWVCSLRIREAQIPPMYRTRTSIAKNVIDSIRPFCSSSHPLVK